MTTPLNEQAVEAAARERYAQAVAEHGRPTEPWAGHSSTTTKAVLAAYFDSLAEQGIVLVEQPTYHRCVVCGREDRGQRDWGLDHAQTCGGEVPRPPGWNEQPSKPVVPTKPCEKCGGSGEKRDVPQVGRFGPAPCPACNGSGGVPVALVDVQEVAEWLGTTHPAYMVSKGRWSIEDVQREILRRFAPERESES